MKKIHAPKSHPRYLSNLYRDMLAEGVKSGITSFQGLIAHGRGEAFDYLLGEKTHPFAEKAIKAAAAMFVLAEYPVVSVNGNTAVLVPKENIDLVELLDAKLEVNLFHQSKEREEQIVSYLKKHGAKEVLLPGDAWIPGVESNRRLIAMNGQEEADIVFAPLEDGDRTEGLIAMGKKVITVDLNPLSRTSQRSTITIVDNIVRAMPLLIAHVKTLRKEECRVVSRVLEEYKNDEVLIDAEKAIRSAGFSKC